MEEVVYRRYKRRCIENPTIATTNTIDEAATTFVSFKV
jgi:hypothetical protein